MFIFNEVMVTINNNNMKNEYFILNDLTQFII